MATWYLAAGDYMLFLGNVSSNPYGLVASNTLVMTSGVVYDPKWFLKANNVLAMVSVCQVAPGSVWYVFAQNDFAITGQCMFVQNLMASNMLFLSHAVVSGRASDTLSAAISFMQSVTCDVIRPGVNKLVFQSKATYQWTGNQTPNNFFNMKGSAACWKLDRRFIATPFVAPTPPSDPNDGHCDTP